MKTAAAAIVAALAAAPAAAPALAGPVSFEYDGTARGRNLDVDIAGFYTGRVFAGNVRHDIDGVSTLGYCIDPNQFVQRGASTFDSTNLTDALSHRPAAAQKAAAIAELADSLGESIWTEQADKDTAAAFQVALWEIVADLNTAQRSASFSLNSGEFRASGNATVLTLAQTMLDSLTFTQGTAHGYNAYTHPDHQDYVTRMVPTPGALALAAAATPLITRRRRR